MTTAHAPRTLSHSAAVVLISSMKKRHIIVSNISPCQHSLSFASSILHKSSKITFEHARHVARIGFKPRPARYSGLNYDHRFINKRMLKLEKTSLTRENKIEQSRSLGCGERKGLT